MNQKSTAACPGEAQERTARRDHSVSAELCAREGSPSFGSSSRRPVQSRRQLLPETGNYPTKVFSSAPYWQTGETKTSQCKQIWKAEEILHVNRITPAREEERSPISLSYLTLRSARQQYYLSCDKRALYSNMMWSSFAWKISSVFSKILLVSRRENGDYTSKPRASMPIAGAFIQYRANSGGFLNCSNSDNSFSFLRMPFGARRAVSCKTGTFRSVGVYPPNYLWGSPQLSPLFRNNLQENSHSRIQNCYRFAVIHLFCS